MKTAEKTAWMPGPWESQRDFDGDNAIYFEDVLIAVTSGVPHVSIEQDCANAKLIAAAPTMAELLNTADRLLTQCYTILCDDAIANRMPGGLKESVHDFVVGNKAGILLAEIERAQ